MYFVQIGKFPNHKQETWVTLTSFKYNRWSKILLHTLQLMDETFVKKGIAIF